MLKPYDLIFGVGDTYDTCLVLFYIRYIVFSFMSIIFNATKIEVQSLKTVLVYIIQGSVDIIILLNNNEILC